MLLKNVKIKNFRSLKDIDVDLGESVILIGENNAGKTSFLDALRIVLSRSNGRYVFDEYDYYMDDELTEPKDSEGIEIILTFQEREVGEWEGFILESFGDIIQYLDNEPELASILLKVSSVYNVATHEFENTGVFLNRNFQEIVGRVQKRVNDFYKLVPFFYLQALRDIKDTFSSRSPLWGKFLKRANISQDKLKEVQDNINQLNDEIIQNDENLSKLVTALEEVNRVLDFEGQNLVSINALPIKTWELLSKAQLMLANNKRVEFPLDRFGQGTQSVTTILLFKAYISILLEELNSSEAEAILSLEEPEAHLHPQAIKAVERVIRSLPCQKIITTHSPYFIQNMDLMNVRLFKKEGNITQVVKLINSVTIPCDDITDGLRSMTSNFQEVFVLDEEKKELLIKQPLDERLSRMVIGCFRGVNISEYIERSRDIFTSKELYNLNMYVQRTRGEILFATKWVLYEGQTEDIVIQYCAEIMGKPLDEFGVSGIFYRGNGSAGAFVKLARVLGIPWVILADNDLQGQSTINEVKNCGYSQEEIQDLIYLTHEKDIENEFVKAGFLEDYENLLGDEITPEVTQLKISGDMESYSNRIVTMVQNGKVESAYRLVDIWKERNMSVDEIPQFIKDFIEGVCEDV